MVKMLVLQSWCGLMDPELERQANDRISFRSFLGFPDVIPDATMVWLFRERLAETDIPARLLIISWHLADVLFIAEITAC